MNDIDTAARRAYDADCSARSTEPSDTAFAAERARWRDIAIAARNEPQAQSLHESTSLYANNVFARQGIDGLLRETERLLNKLETAAMHQYAGSTLDLMAGTAAYRARAAVQYARGDATSLALELDGLQARVVEVQRLVDPHSKAALILNVDAEKWEKYPSYQAHLDALKPERHTA